MKTWFQTLVSSENFPLGSETVNFYQKEHMVPKKYVKICMAINFFFWKVLTLFRHFDPTSCNFIRGFLIFNTPGWQGLNSFLRIAQMHKLFHEFNIVKWFFWIRTHFVTSFHAMSKLKNGKSKKSVVFSRIFCVQKQDFSCRSKQTSVL